MNDLLSDENYIDYSYDREYHRESQNNRIDPETGADDSVQDFSLTTWILTLILNAVFMHWGTYPRSRERSRLEYLNGDDFDRLFTDQ